MAKFEILNSVDSGDQAVADAQELRVSRQAERGEKAEQTPLFPLHAAHAKIQILSDLLYDLEKTRIAQENRVQALRADPKEYDGKFGKGIKLDITSDTELEEIANSLKNTEAIIIKKLESVVKQSGYKDFVDQRVGLGLKQFGRLIGALGDPGWNFKENRPRRGPAELWAYCGLDPKDGEARLRKKGEKVNWNTGAKTRAYLCAESLIKQTGWPNKNGISKARSEYRDVYDRAVVQYENAIHQKPCKRCGPAGKPAPEGSPLSKGHKHARALRKVEKQLLKDLWKYRNRMEE